MKITNKINFGIQRKIVANMTSESWKTIPHVTYNYEPDVTEFVKYCKARNKALDVNVSLNTYFLKCIVEGLKAAPIMNSHIEYNPLLVRGEIKTFEDINVSMPMILPNGEMMTINLHNLENMSVTEIQDLIADVRRRADNTNFTEAMFEVSMDNTIKGLKKGKIVQTLGRLIGAKTGKYKVKTLTGEAKEEYYSIPVEDRLTKRDIEQGTVTVSNIGSIYRGQRGNMCILEIIPPQVSAFGVGAVQDRPVVVTDDAGNKSIEIRQVLPICIAFDHRALDFGEAMPFIERLDDIFANPKQIAEW